MLSYLPLKWLYFRLKGIDACFRLSPLTFSQSLAKLTAPGPFMAWEKRRDLLRTVRMQIVEKIDLLEEEPEPSW